MYAGHAAVALALKTREPRIPMAVLVAACFGPDWVELFLGLFLGRAAGETYSHFIPGVLLGASAAALLYAVVFRRPGSRWVAIGWLSHWPADFLTAHKPLIDPGHVVGLDFYDLPKVDFLIEASLLAVAAWLYMRAFAPDTLRRRWVAVAALALVSVQSVLDYGLQHEPWRQWNPSLARAQWQPHLTVASSGSTLTPLRTALALSPASIQRGRDGEGRTPRPGDTGLPHVR
ncbi:MAG TPA: hypothetical protein VFP15_13070 [Gemmatimonadaceae bacterium]|nr:hypothetical protein [Gemmatimonadaceae bacterium]